MGNGDAPQDSGKVDVNLNSDDDADDDFEHPEDVPTSNADDVPEVNSAEDVVDGDTDRMAALQNKAQQMQEENDAADDGTPVNLGDGGTEVADTPDEDPRYENEADADTISQAGDSLFTDEEAEEAEDAFGDDFELETLEDIPEDFDYEDQDTSHYGGDDEADIRHNGVVFHLEKPEGRREEAFWGEMENVTSLSDMFDLVIRYSVTRPRDIAERMEEENWDGFAKAGLATKCSSFLGLDALQDF